LRKIIKTRGSFPNDEAALKLLYLAIKNAGLRTHRNQLTQSLRHPPDREHRLNDHGVVDRPLRLIGRARHSHQPASFGDGEATGPMTTDVVPLLGGGALFRAPFRNSSSRACLPTSRSRAAIRASYS
jgi:hypothetical protein